MTTVQHTIDTIALPDGADTAFPRENPADLRLAWFLATHRPTGLPSAATPDAPASTVELNECGQSTSPYADIPSYEDYDFDTAAVDKVYDNLAFWASHNGPGLLRDFHYSLVSVEGEAGMVEVGVYLEGWGMYLTRSTDLKSVMYGQSFSGDLAALALALHAVEQWQAASKVAGHIPSPRG